jgi:uncharacterized protein YajQ (UPF0234 family)
MPSFDVVSELDMQEVRNAVDQAAREVSTRFDFKGTDTSVVLDADAKVITLRTITEVKAQAVLQIVEEKLVKRNVSTRALDPGKVEDAAGGTVRQVIGLNAGISDTKAKEIAKHVKELKLKGVQVQIQGDQLRVQAKQRDDLQQAMQAMREHDFGIPLQFTNRRD